MNVVARALPTTKRHRCIPSYILSDLTMDADPGQNNRMEAISPSPTPDLQSLLFTLPTELRWQIYTHLLTTAPPHSKGSKIQISASGSPIHPLLQITRQIRHDAFLPLCTAQKPSESREWDNRPSILRKGEDVANVFLRVEANWRERLKKFLEILDGFSEGEDERRRRRGMVRYVFSNHRADFCRVMVWLGELPC